MITLRRANDRRHERRRRQESWLTFDPRDDPDPLDQAFGCLEILGEHRLPPGTSVAHPRQDAEIVTYVREGALAYGDSMGSSGVIHTGEFQHMTARRDIRHRETNVSRSDWAHVFQSGYARPRRGWRLVGSRNASAQLSGAACCGSWPRPTADEARYAFTRTPCCARRCLDPGQHVVHELGPGRSAWLHVVKGAVTLGDMVVGNGDGAGLSGERAVSLTARTETELLLVDLREAPVSAPPARSN